MSETTVTIEPNALGSLLIAWARQSIESLLENDSVIPYIPTDEELLTLLDGDKDLDAILTHARYRIDDMVYDTYIGDEEDEE